MLEAISLRTSNDPSTARLEVSTIRAPGWTTWIVSMNENTRRALQRAAEIARTLARGLDATPYSVEPPTGGVDQKHLNAVAKHLDKAVKAHIAGLPTEKRRQIVAAVANREIEIALRRHNQLSHSQSASKKQVSGEPSDGQH